VLGYFILGVALLLSLLLIARWVVATDPRVLAKGVRYGGGAAAAGLAVYLMVSGRWPYAMVALSAALPFILRWRMLRDRFRAASGPTPGKRSEVETRMLHMILDHDSGDMSGTVLAGAQAGRGLETLTFFELLDLREECRVEDPQSVSLLESYLERRYGADWRDRTEAKEEPGGPRGSGPRKPSTAMTRAEALDILGLEEGVAPEAIKEAYRRLMMKLHPDAGGTAYLAAKLNQAKDLLLGE
jgi:DnaJ-like protein